MHNEELSHKLHIIIQFQILWNTHHTPATEENEISSSLYTLPLSAYTWHDSGTCDPSCYVGRKIHSDKFTSKTNTTV